MKIGNILFGALFLTDIISLLYTKFTKRLYSYVSVILLIFWICILIIYILYTKIKAEQISKNKKIRVVIRIFLVFSTILWVLLAVLVRFDYEISHGYFHVSLLQDKLNLI